MLAVKRSPCTRIVSMSFRCSGEQDRFKPTTVPSLFECKIIDARRPSFPDQTCPGSPKYHPVPNLTVTFLLTGPLKVNRLFNSTTGGFSRDLKSTICEP